VFSVAGCVWDVEFSRFEYREQARRDLRQAVARVGVGGIWQARRDAQCILTAHRRVVLRWQTSCTTPTWARIASFAAYVGKQVR
jgi:hypothetical protein